MDIRQGRLATRLLRPLHPLLAYSAQHLAAVPLRILISTPLLIVLWVVAGDQLAFGDPTRMAVLALSLIGAWLLLFFTMAFIGSLALFMDSALAVFEIWLGLHYIFSGYLIPLELFPGWVRGIARTLPFHYTLGFPVETLVGLNDLPRALQDLGYQWAYVAAMGVATLLIWRAGMRRFVAFGG